LRLANAFLSRELDLFSAIARGDIEVWGQLPKVDTLILLLDRIPADLL
jgi:hypothetical protein